MKIKKILSRNRRDFKAIYVCEHCDETEESYGYDDSHFHNTVIPSMVCKKCGETSPENYVPMKPKYPANALI